MSVRVLILPALLLLATTAACQTPQPNSAFAQRQRQLDKYPRTLSEERIYSVYPPGPGVPANGGQWQPFIRKQYTYNIAPTSITSPP